MLIIGAERWKPETKADDFPPTLKGGQSRALNTENLTSVVSSVTTSVF